MMRLRYLIVASVAACLASCGEEPADPGTVEHPFAGEFDWAQSRGGLAYHERSPDTEGYSVRLEFTGDAVRAFRNGELVGTTRFTVRHDSLRAGPLPVYVIRYDDPLQVFAFDAFEEHTVRIGGKLILEFDDPCCDRYTHVFTKHGVR